MLERFRLALLPYYSVPDLWWNLEKLINNTKNDVSYAKNRKLDKRLLEMKQTVRHLNQARVHFFILKQILGNDL